MKKIYEFFGFNKEGLHLDITVDKIVERNHLSGIKNTIPKEALNNIGYICLEYTIKDRENTDRALQVIEVGVDEPKQCDLLFEVLKRVAPYSLLVVFVSKDKYRPVFADRYCHYNENCKIYDLGWKYEEEITKEFIDNCMDEYAVESILTLENFYENFDYIYNLCTEVEFICFRHLLDLVRIREKIKRISIMKKLLCWLYSHGKIEVLDIGTCVVKVDFAERVFNSYYGRGFSVVLEDARYKTDNYYDVLDENELFGMEDSDKIFEELNSGQMERELYGKDIDDLYAFERDLNTWVY